MQGFFGKSRAAENGEVVTCNTSKTRRPGEEN